jgi:hypothetical protein
MPTDYFKLAQSITRKYARDLKDAENSARAPRIAEEHAISRAELARMQNCSVSMNDIIEAAGAEGLLRDPLLKNRLKSIGSFLNSDFNRF